MAFNPYFFNDSPLPMELIYKALAELKEINKNVIPTVEELKKKVNELLNDLDEVIKEEVTEIINNMYESGELAEIIGTIVANSIQGKSGDFDLSHMGYSLHTAHSYGMSELPTNYNNLTIDEELFSALQGNCVFKIGGNHYWACCYVVQNGGSFDHSDSARIFVYQINSDGSMTYITDKVFAILGHCNSMTFLDGYLYIAPNSYVGSGGGSTTDIHRISFDGSTLGGTWHPASQTYRAETKTPTGWIYDTAFCDNICAYGDKLYVCDSVMNLYSYDWEDNEVTLEIERLNGTEGRTMLSDGFAMDDNYIYIGAQYYKIKRYNKALGTIDWCYTLPQKCNNKMWKLGEVEGFTVLDGVLYVAGFYNLCGVSTVYNTYSVTHFYRQNLSTNNIAPTSSYNWSNGYVLRKAYIYVSGSLPNDTDNPTNDIGLNTDTAFKCIQMALDFIEVCYWINRAEIRVNQYRNLSTVDIKTSKELTITGEAYKTAHSGTRPSVGHIFIAPTSNVTIAWLNVCNVLPSDFGNADILRTCILCTSCSNLVLEDMVYPVGLNANCVTVQNAMDIRRSNANIRIASASGDTTQTNWNTYRAENGVTSPQILRSYIATINAHGTITLDGNTDIIG